MRGGKKPENPVRCELVAQKYAFANSKSWGMISNFVVCREVFLGALTKTENCYLSYWALHEDKDYQRFLKFIFSIKFFHIFHGWSKQSLFLLCYLDFWTKTNLLYPLLYGTKFLPPYHYKSERSSSFLWLNTCDLWRTTGSLGRYL